MMEELINNLIREGYLRTPLIIEAFRNINREDFVLPDLKGEADINAPLPIGYGQTISQPLTVAFMLELLQPQPGNKILDIGSGSGWQTALLAYIVSQQGNSKSEARNSKHGKIYAIERIPELVEFGKKNVAKYNFLAPYRTEGSGSGIEKESVEFILGDGSKGLKKEAPFDKIIAAAAAEKIPEEWKKQLKIGGRLVTPVRDSIWLLIKKDKNKFEEKEFPGFAFVPLIHD